MFADFIHIIETSAVVGAKRFGIKGIVGIAVRRCFVIAGQARKRRIRVFTVTSVRSGKVWMRNATASVPTNVMIGANFRRHGSETYGIQSKNADGENFYRCRRRFSGVFLLGINFKTKKGRRR